MRSLITAAARLGGAAVALVATVAAIPVTASAHTGFDYSIPADGASVAEPVAEVTIAFTEAVSVVGDGFEAIDPQNNILQPPVVTDDNLVFRLQFDPALAGGVVGVKYTVAADDGHVLEGSFTFTVSVDAPTTVVPTLPPSTVVPTPTTTAAPVTEAPGSSVTSVDTPTPAPSTTGPTAVVATPVTTASSGSDGPSNTGWFVAIGVAVVALGVGLLLFRSRRSVGG